MPPCGPKDLLTLVLRPLSLSSLFILFYFSYSQTPLACWAPNFLKRTQHQDSFSRSWLKRPRNPCQAISPWYVTLLPLGSIPDKSSLWNSHWPLEAKLTAATQSSLGARCCGPLLFTVLESSVQVCVPPYTWTHQQQNFSLLFIWIPSTHMVVKSFSVHAVSH